MKKEKINNKKELNTKITICFMMIVLILTLTIIANYSMKLKTELENCNDPNETSNANEEANNQQELTYDCSFTRTYNIVNTLDGYRSEVFELSYVVIDAFQDHYARTHVIPTKLKDSLKNNTTYEFTYTIKGTGVINDMDDIHNKIVATTIYEEDKDHVYNEPTLKVNLNIKQTDKLGMSQLQEPICKGK